MFNLASDLGVQSYCFRTFKPLPDLLREIQALGLNRTELCGVHADFNDEPSFAGVIGQFRTAGVAIGSIGVQYFRGDPAEEKWFAFAKAAGAKMISTSFELATTPASMDKAEALAEKYDLLLGIHNHGGYDWLGSWGMISHVLATRGPRLGLCIDTAWCLQAAGDPVEWAQKLSGRLFGVHVKDFVFDRAGRWSDVIVGTGNLRLPAFLQAALAAPRLVAVTLEYEGDANNPGPALRECVAAVRAAAGK
jgi:sugar phosphate isomerase/epimerase